MNRARVIRVASAVLVAAAFSGLVAPSARAQQRQANSNQSEQSPHRSGPAIPQDTRVRLPGDSRLPLGGGSLQGPPPTPARGRPAQTPQPGSPGPAGATGGIDCPPTVAPPPYGPRYGPVYGPVYGGYPGYRRYGYTRVYNDGPYYPPYGDDGPVDTGPIDNGRVEPPRRDPRDAGAVAAADDPHGVPDLPPEEVLGEQEMTPALKQALDASPEWKQATADLVRAWAAYADAVDAALGTLKDKPEYRRAQAEMHKARARFDAVRSAGNGAEGRNARVDAAPDRLLAAADAALKARRLVRALESSALSADPDVQRAERRLDNAVERRNEIRAKVAATLPQPAQPKRPKLLEDD